MRSGLFDLFKAASEKERRHYPAGYSEKDLANSSSLEPALASLASSLVKLGFDHIAAKISGLA